MILPSSLALSPRGKRSGVSTFKTTSSSVFAARLQVQARENTTARHDLSTFRPVESPSESHWPSSRESLQLSGRSCRLWGEIGGDVHEPTSSRRHCYEREPEPTQHSRDVRFTMGEATSTSEADNGTSCSRYFSQQLLVNIEAHHHKVLLAHVEDLVLLRERERCSAEDPPNPGHPHILP